MEPKSYSCRLDGGLPVGLLPLPTSLSGLHLSSKVLESVGSGGHGLIQRHLVHFGSTRRVLVASSGLFSHTL